MMFKRKIRRVKEEMTKVLISLSILVYWMVMFVAVVAEMHNEGWCGPKTRNDTPFYGRGVFNFHKKQEVLRPKK